MSEKEPIELLRMRDLVLQIRESVADEVVELLESTTLGTPGGTRYKHVGSEAKIREVRNPYFLELWKGKRLLGALCMAHRQTDDPEATNNAFYIRYLSVMDAMQRKVNKDTADASSGTRSNSLLKRVLHRFYDNPEVLMQLTGREHAVFYAYVELDNERSRQMTSNMGFEQIGKFSTLIFSRIFPKRNRNARRLGVAERSSITALLAETYRDHALFSTANLFYQDNYWVLEEEGEIVAGLQAAPIQWVITEMPGLSGKATLKMLPWVPLVNRMFNPRKWQFIVVDAIYCKPGREKALHQLMAHACVENGVYSALLWLDHLDPLYGRLKKYGKLGVLNRVNGDTPASIIARFNGVSPKDQKRIRTQPRYISAFDST